MMQKVADRFVRCIEQKKYYEAHEVLEAQWFAHRFEDRNDIKLLKGCINAAVSFELYKRGRYTQAKKVWMNYLKYRQLLYKIDTKEYNTYHYLVRFLDAYQKELLVQKKQKS